MKLKYLILILVFLFQSLSHLSAQPDIIPPETPEMKLVTVNYLTGNVTLTWSKSSSADASGYVVYLFRNGESHALDTIFNPDVLSYIKTGPASGYFTESFVVAAFDTAGNISPLSNQLNTIYTENEADTCNNALVISWNYYNGVPFQVLEYQIWQSINSSSFEKAATVTPETDSFSIKDFQNGSTYCFFIKAILTGGFESSSNKSCTTVKIQKAPAWINTGNIATAKGGTINLTFTPDPATELRNFIVERRTGLSGTFENIGAVTGAGSMAFSDDEIDSTVLYSYRVSSVNNCGKKVTWSNQATNIVLGITQAGEDNILLKWNQYRQWAGEFDETRIILNKGDGIPETLTVADGDTTLLVRISDYMYQATEGSLCFRAVLYESENPYGLNGTASSNAICFEIKELINVPNLFTPDGNLINDLFRPVLSFTPRLYELVITDTGRRIVFKSNDPLESWDGSNNGKPPLEGVYLWILKITTTSGKVISRSGNVTLMMNR